MIAEVLLEGCEDFDDLLAGGFVAEQLGGYWTTWSLDPGGIDDATVIDTHFNSPNNSFVIDNTSVDLLYMLGDEPISSGTYYYSHYMYIPSGHSGYFNVQSDPVPGVGWVIELYFADGGTGNFAGQSTETFLYPQDTWFFVEIGFGMDGEVAQVHFDGEFIVEFQNTMTIGGINYFGSDSGGTPGAFYDDVCFLNGWIPLLPPENLEGEPMGADAQLWWDAPGGDEKGVILCVDRDGSADLDFTDEWQYIQPAMDVLGLDYDYYEVTDLSSDGPDLITMQQYDLVFWFCGEGWELNQTMTDNDEANLAAYLDDGGRLLLSAFDYFWDRYPDAGNFSFGQFPYDYLGVSSTVQDNWSIFSPETASAGGVEGSFADGINFEVTDIYSTDKDGLYIDFIIPVDQELFVVTNPSPSGNAAVQFDGGTFRTVFTSLPVAAITEQYAREQVLEAAFSWLSGSNPGLLGYNIYYQHEMGGFNQIDFTTTTNYVDVDAMNYGLHEYFVTAVYQQGESMPSNTIWIMWDGMDNPEPEPIHFYPNPAVNKIRIQSISGIVTVEVYNFTGQKLLKYLPFNNNLLLDISDLNNGIYLLKVQTNKGWQSHKIVVKR